MSAARDFTARRFGALVTNRTRYPVIGQTNVIARRNNPNCIVLLITNIGSTNIFLSYEPDPLNDPMFLLLGNGAAFSSRVDLDGDLVGATIYAVSDAPAGRLAVVEGVQEVVTEPAGV